MAKKVYDEMENAGQMMALGGMVLVEYSVSELEENAEGFLFIPVEVGGGVGW